MTKKFFGRDICNEDQNMYENANFLLNLCYVAKKLEGTYRSSLKKVTYIMNLKYLIF